MSAAALALASVAMTGAPASAAPGPGWLHTNGAVIETADGRPYVIKAVAWFGMETASCAPHGLWQISLDDGLARIASFGFTYIHCNDLLATKHFRIELDESSRSTRRSGIAGAQCSPSGRALSRCSMGDSMSGAVD